jgi:hypothetical protein
MHPYESVVLRALLKDITVKVESKETDTLDLVEGDVRKVVEFFNRYFVRINGLVKEDGSEPSRDEQLAWLKKNSKLGIEQAVVLRGFGGVRVKPEENPDKNLFLAGDTAMNVVECEQTIFHLDFRMPVKITMLHHFREENEIDNRRFQSAQGRTRILSRQQQWQRLVDYSIIEGLYNSMIQSVIGMTVSGQPCTEENKPKWVSLVPLWHKDLTITELFRTVSVKNA